MNSVFSEEILADKLSKLDSTQQCIETLSHWCIFHRSNAELVVKTWDKQFRSSQLAQKVPLLYLSNDILQNSKRTGNEFVTEFWKVLPAALKDVVQNGDDHGKNAVSRLVNIWEERRVFGSRQKSLQDVMLGEELPPPLELNTKRRRAVRIIKRDSHAIKTKLSIGGAAEKIVTAYHLVLSEHPVEDAEMNKCKSSVNQVRKMEKDVDEACTIANNPNKKNLAKELEEEENILQPCIGKLKLAEANRIALIAQLKEALHEQEAELENVRTQMQVAQAQIVECNNMRKRLNDDNHVGVSRPKRTAAALAAEVADRLTASSSSQFIMSSVLSTFAAEAAKSAGLSNSSPSPNTFHSTPFNSTPFNSITNSMSKPDSNPYIMAQQSPQYQYHTFPNPSPNPPSHQQYVQYNYGSIPTPAIPQDHVVGTMVQVPNQQPLQMVQQQQHVSLTPLQSLQLLGQQPLQMNQQPLQMGQQQPMALTQSQSLQLSSQQPLAPPSFRPHHPPDMVYYGHPHHS